MPQYSVRCQVCEQQGSQRLTFAEYDEAKAGKLDVTCPHCGGWAAIMFDPGNVTFVLKDGESGGWVSKAGKETPSVRSTTRSWIAASAITRRGRRFSRTSGEA